MGPLRHRTYNEVAGGDTSGLGVQVAAQRQRVAHRLRDVARVVAVVSGKGGVGKTFVTAALARGAAPHFQKGVGVLDGDLKSPTAARLLAASGPLRIDDAGVLPATGEHGIKVMSTELLLDEGAPLRWKGPATEEFLWREILETGALREFLSDVVWGGLDLLLVDMPADADRLGDLAALVPSLTGAVFVTIPSEESRRSVERAMRSARDANVRMLGVVENMSGYLCVDCGRSAPLFEGNAGDALARAFGVPLLARLPLAPPGARASLHQLSELTSAFFASLA
ncbi:MAG TPA: P-loop NTPase [Gemmatimonadaceae bacterium]|nr:P-loop NTPase [Gemmatimonadaceae bacterium]